MRHFADLPSLSRWMKGSTLIEILVTLLIVSIGMLGLSGLQANAVKANLDAAQQSQAMWIVQEMAERMRANPLALSGNNPTGTEHYQLAANQYAQNPPPCANFPPTVCADSPLGAVNGALTCGSTATEAADMAEHDVAEVYCGYNVNGVLTDSSDSLSLLEMDITATPSPMTTFYSPVYYTVTLKWQSKVITDLAAMSTEEAGITDRYQGDNASGNAGEGWEIQYTTYTFIP